MSEDFNFDDLATAMLNVESMGKSEAAQKFEGELQEAEKLGLGFWDKMGILVDNPAGGIEVLANSFGRMLGSGTEASGVAAGVGMGGVTAGAYGAVGAAGGSVVPGAGTAVGGTVGAGAGFMKGFMGGISGMVDAHATIMEILKEELQMNNMETTGENLEKIFNTPEITDRMRSQAIARGVAIGVFDSLAAVGSGKAMSMAASSGTRALRSTTGKAIVGGAVETVGAGVGETAAQLVSTGEVDGFETAMEMLGSVATSSVTVATNMPFTPSYKIDGQTVSAKDAQDFITGGQDLARLEIKNDDEMSTRASKIRKGQKPAIKATREMVAEEAARNGVDLDQAAQSSAVDFAFSNAQQALNNGNPDLAQQIVRAGIDHARKLHPKGVSQINYDTQSTAAAAKVLATSKYSAEGRAAFDLERSAAANRNKSKSSVGRGEKSRLAALAESQQNEAKAKRAALRDRYKKMATAEPKKARAIQRLDVDINSLEIELSDKNITTERKIELENELKKKVQQRTTIDTSFDAQAVNLDKVQATVDVKEQVESEVKSLEKEEASLTEKLESVRQKADAGEATLDDVLNVEADVAAVAEERKALSDALNMYNTARNEYDSNPSSETEGSVVEASNVLAGALGIDIEAEPVAQTEATAQWSAETQAENHFADSTEGGTLGSTYTLDGKNQIGQSKAAVSIFNERSKIVPGKMTKEEMVEVLNDFKEANKDIFEGNEDVLSIGTYYDAQSDQTFIDVSAVVDKKAAVELGKQYNQVSVFALDTMEEIATGGDGKEIEGLKPEIERVADIRGILGKDKADDAKKVGPDEYSDIDALVEETRGETKETKEQPTSKYPENAVQTPRKDDGSANWSEGDGGLTAQEAKMLNKFQALADKLGINIVVHPDAETAGSLDGGKHGSTWGGLFTGDAIHLSPATIRENQRLEYGRGEGLKKTKSFAETLQEEVMHAMIGKSIHEMYSANPRAAVKFKNTLLGIAGGNKDLLQRVEVKEQSYRADGKSEAEVFEESTIELLSAFASGEVEIGLVDRVRIAINKMLIALHGAMGKDLAITNADSMRSIIAKFAMAQDQGITFGSTMEAESSTTASQSNRVSPTMVPKNDDGTVTIKYLKPIYKYFGFGERKDIGTAPVEKTFRDQWHFINWWKKATDMGRKTDLSGFTDKNGATIDVDRIKTYGTRKSNRISGNQVKQTAQDLNRMVAAAEAQGLISKPVAAAVRRKVAPLLRMINQAESRGESNPKAFSRLPQLKERLQGLQSHVEGIINREADAKGKKFKFRGDEETRASESLFDYMTSLELLPFSQKHLDIINRALSVVNPNLMGGRVATYEAMRQFLEHKFGDNPEQMKAIFIGLMGKYIVDSEYRSLKFGNENPLDYFSNYQVEAEAKVDEAMKSGVITGSRLDNLAKMNFLAALLSAKNQAKPNMEAVLQLMAASEKFRVDGTSGITEGLAKMVGSGKVKGASGVGVRSYAKAIRKLNAIISGDLDSVKGISPTFKKLYAERVKEGGFIREDGEINWTDLTKFLLSPYQGINVIPRTMSQALFGYKIGAWTLNMNQGLFPNMNDEVSGKLGDIVTVDTHVYNSTQLVMLNFDGAEYSAMAAYVKLAKKLQALGMQIPEGVDLVAIEKGIQAARVDTEQNLFGVESAYDGPNVTFTRDAENTKRIKDALGQVKDLVRGVDQAIANLQVEGRTDDANALIRILDQISNPSLPESNPRKRQSAEFVADITESLREAFPDHNINASTVGQLIFADRQVFAGHNSSALFDQNGNLSPSLDYKTYGGALRGLPAIGTKSDVRASQLLLYPTEAGKQDATESSLFRTRKPEEALAVLKTGGLINNRIVNEALSTDATSRRIIAKENVIEVGQQVGIRLNLNVMKNTGVPVQTMHNKTATGEALKYAGAVMVKNPVLNVNQNARKKIVTFQENKFPMASVDGEFLTDNIDLMNFDGVKAFFNPFKQNVFVDAAGRPIKSAEEATIVGNTVYLRGDIEYYGFNDPILEQGRSETAEEKAKRVKRGDKYEKALKRFEAMAARNGVEFDSRLELEQAYDNMPIESKVALDESEVAANMEQAQTRASSRLKIRRTAGKQARKYPSVRAEIIDNANNYFAPQVLKDLKGELSGKTDAELIGMMRGDALGNLQSRNDDLGVLATAELISRAVARGEMEAVPYLVEQAAAMGTTAGRILRHLRELKGSTPQGLVSVINSAVQKRGNKLSDSQQQRLERMAEDLYRLQAEHEELMRQAIAGDDVEIELEAVTRRVKSVERELDTFTNGVIERGWGQIGTMLIQGNLLTPMSQITNVGANMVNALGKVAVDAIALPTERLINAFGIESNMKRNYSINAYMYGLRKFGQGFVEALDSIATGQDAEVTEWRVHRGFAPFRSLMAAMGKGDLPLGPDGTVSNSQRVKLAVQGTLGVPAETMFRFLSLGDTPFRRYVEGIELYQAARAQGLEGDELMQFLKHPTKAQKAAAEIEGRKLTFQERTVLSDLAEDSISFLREPLRRA